MTINSHDSILYYNELLKTNRKTQLHKTTKKNTTVLIELVRTDFKLRYQGSVLGYAWSVLRPLMLFVILYTVFVKFLKIGGQIPHYPIYLLLGIVLWGFFSEMTSLSLTSIVARGDVIRKVSISRNIIVVSTSITALINMSINLLIVGTFLLVNKADLLVTALWIPLILVQLYAFSLGLSLLLSAMFVKYRDVGHIWEVVLQGMFYLTPVLYPLSLITNVRYQKLLLLNPAATALQDARYALVTHDTITISSVYGTQWARLLPYGITLAVLAFGAWYFRKESKYFAENI